MNHSDFRWKLMNNGDNIKISVILEQAHKLIETILITCPESEDKSQSFTKIREGVELAVIAIQKKVEANEEKA